MSNSPTVQVHRLYERAHKLQYSSPFIQSQCTSGALCGAQFARQGCYASPDYSTCHYDSSQGVSTCTVCICYGFDTGQSGCDTSNPAVNTYRPQPGESLSPLLMS